MKSRGSALSSAKDLGDSMRVAGANNRKAGETTMAAGRVVAERMNLGAAAMIDPCNADFAEFAKIIPEKTVAFSAAGMTWLQWSGEIAERIAGFAAGEMAQVAEAAAAIASCRTPAGVIAAQSRFATAWFARALAQSIALGSLTLRTQGAAMAPMHRATTANARRLSR
jgi:hypothetical protein